jgi:hypothetical protein
MKIKNLKLKNKNEHFQKKVCSIFFLCLFFYLNNQLGKNEMEMIINDQTNENSSSIKQEIISDDHRQSFKGLKKKSHRRSTMVGVPLINANDLNIPSKPRSNSDQSIILIKEKSSYFYHSNSNSDEEKHFRPGGTTRIKLSLPLTSNTKISHRHQTSNLTEEFTLPTNPPITVTIEPHNHFNDRIEKENSLHDDQICSPENIHRNQQTIHLDSSSFKNTSTIMNYFMDLLKPSDNKLAMKLFGSRKGVLKERLRQQRAGHCIIHPCSNFR